MDPLAMVPNTVASRSRAKRMAAIYRGGFGGAVRKGTEARLVRVDVRKW